MQGSELEHVEIVVVFCSEGTWCKFVQNWKKEDKRKENAHSCRSSGPKLNSDVLNNIHMSVKIFEVLKL